MACALSRDHVCTAATRCVLHDSIRPAVQDPMDPRNLTHRKNALAVLAAALMVCASWSLSLTQGRIDVGPLAKPVAAPPPLKNAAKAKAKASTAQKARKARPSTAKRGSPSPSPARSKGD